MINIIKINDSELSMVLSILDRLSESLKHGIKTRKITETPKEDIENLKRLKKKYDNLIKKIKEQTGVCVW